MKMENIKNGTKAQMVHKDLDSTLQLLCET